MSRLRPRTVQELHRVLADATVAWRQSGQPASLRHYVLAYGAVHLRAIEDHERLWQLLQSEEYRRAQLETFQQYQAAYRALREGIDLYVERDGATPEDDPRLCRLALRAGTLANEAKGDIQVAFEWVRDRPLEDLSRMEDALQRLSVLDDVAFFKASLSLLWIEVDRQADLPEVTRSGAAARLVLEAVDTRLPAGTRAVDWSKFLKTDFMAWLAVHLIMVLPPVTVGRLFAPVNSWGMEQWAYSLTKLLERMKSSIPEPCVRLVVSAAERIPNLYDRTLVLQRLIHMNTLPHKAVVLTEALRIALAIEYDVSQFRDDQLRSLVSFSSSDVRKYFTQCQLLRAIAFELADSNETEQALKVARAIRSLRIRSAAEAHVAEVLAGAGQREAADKIFQQSIEAAHVVQDGDECAHALAEVARVLSQTGNNAWALDVAHTIPNAQERSVTLSTIGLAVTATGDLAAARMVFQEAIFATRAVSNDWDRTKALDSLVSALQQAHSLSAHDGLLEQARDIATTIQNPLNRLTTLSRLVKAQERDTDRDHTYETIQQLVIEARTITSVDDKVKTLLCLAEALVQNGEREHAVQMVREAAGMILLIRDGDRQVKAFADTAQLVSQAATMPGRDDLFRTMLDTIHGVSFPYIGAAVVGITRAIAQATDLAQRDVLLQIVVNMVCSRNGHDYGQWDVKAVVEVLLAAGYLSGALEVIRRTVSPSYRCDLLADTAMALAKNRTRAFQDVCDECIETAHSLSDSDSRSRVMSSIVASLVAAGDLVRGRELFTEAFSRFDIEIEKALYHAIALTDLAQVLSATDQPLRSYEACGKALDSILVIEDEKHRSQALVRIANRLIGTEMLPGRDRLLQRVVDAARAINASWHRAEALSKIVVALAQAGELRPALDILELIDAPGLRRDTLYSVAKASAGFGHLDSGFDQALRIAKLMKNPVDRLDALSRMASLAAAVRDESTRSALVLTIMTAVEEEEDDGRVWSPYRARAFVAIASSLLHAGRVREGVTAARRAVELTRANLDTTVCIFSGRDWIAVAELLDKMAGRGEALEFLQRVVDFCEAGTFGVFMSGFTDEQSRLKALTGVAAALASIGAGEGAADLFERVLAGAAEGEEDASRQQLLLGVGEAVAKAETLPRGRELLERVLRLTADGLMNESDRDRVFGSVGMALVKARRINEALDAIRGVSKEARRVFLLCQVLFEIGSARERVSDVLQEDGVIDRIWAEVESIDTAEVETGSVAELGVALAQVGRFASALDTIRNMGASSNQSSAMATIAGTIIRAGRSALVREWMESANIVRSAWLPVLHGWRQALIEFETAPLPWLRASLRYHPFSSQAAYDGVRVLHLAHLKSGNRETFEAIVRQCPQLGLEFLLSQN